MWQDAHIPLAYYFQDHPLVECTDQILKRVAENMEPNVDKMFHEGLLPNLVTYIPYCNYWKQTKKKKNFTFIESLIWLISKAIPWRCNVRAIRNTFTKDCLPDHPGVYDIVVSFFTCSLLGAYRHARNAPCFATRLDIYGYMIFKPLKRSYMVIWFQQQENQSILQNVIREFVVFGTAQIPALRGSMIKRHKWNQVEDSCYKAMDKFREHINKTYMEGSVHWFKSIANILNGFDDYHLRFHEARPNPRLFIEKMSEECINFEDTNYSKPEYREQLFTEQEQDCLKQLIIRHTNYDVPFYILAKQEPIPQSYMYRKSEVDPWKDIMIDANKNPFETDHKKLTQLRGLMYGFYNDHDIKPLGDFLKSLTVYEYQKVSCFFHNLKEKQSVRLLIMPMHYYEAQLSALCKKHHVICPSQIPPRAGLYYYSRYCGFKGFVIPLEKPNQKTSNLNACGSHEAMYSFEKGKVFCFHKINKSKRRKQNPRKRTSIEMFSMFQEKNYKRISKDNRKQKTQTLCSQTPLLEIPLIGYALECQDGVITLCCKCANPATFAVNKFEGAMFICTRCNKEENLYNEVTCFNCSAIQKRDEQFVYIDVLDDIRKETQVLSSIHLCKKCKRKWIVESDVTLPLSIIMKGIDEKWRSRKTGDGFIAVFDKDTAKKRKKQCKKTNEPISYSLVSIKM